MGLMRAFELDDTIAREKLAPTAVALRRHADEPIERLLFDWKWMSLFFNRVNTAMGKNPLYPFEISKPVADKPGFVHRVLRESAADARIK